MPKFKNVSPLGALDLPLVGRVVAHGEVIEVPVDKAKHLQGQADWEPVKTTRSRTGNQEADQAPEQDATQTADGDHDAAGTDQDQE